MNPQRTLAGRYVVDEQLGGGGTATVYRARDLKLNSWVAVKELRPQYASLAPARRRFLREAAIARRLTHSGIVQVLDSDEDGPAVFLVMELVQGETLRQLMQRLGAMGAGIARPVVMRLAEILAYAHQQGVVHRDVKPENVFITGRPYLSTDEIVADDNLWDRIKLGDFGQARVTALTSLTGSSVTWGTPEYMAPEVFARGPMDPRSDLYSLGVMLHELLTGRLPWARAQALARLGPALKGAAVTLAPTGHEPELDHVIAELLAPLPEQRPAGGLAVYLRLRDGQGLPVSRPVKRGSKCFGCGGMNDRDVPMCLSCGRPTIRFGHTPQGQWRVVLRSLRDDAAATERLLELLAAVAQPRRVGDASANAWATPASSPNRLIFLTEGKHMYAKDELKRAIALPTVLFQQLDETTARGLEQMFRARNLDVQAQSEEDLSSFLGAIRKHRLSKNDVPAALGLAILPATLAVDISSSVPLVLAVSSVVTAIAYTYSAHKQQKDMRLQRAHFTLNGRAVSMPLADSLFADATAALAKVQLPQARALFADVATSLCRLARHAELRAMSGEPEGVARRVLAAAPEIGRRIATLAQRLQEVDAALADGSDGELLQALGRLERRLAATAGADARDQRHGLEQTRARLEQTLARRQDLDEQRDHLASTLCGLLARLHTACADAEALLAPGTDDDAHVLDQALGEVERMLQRSEAPEARSSSL